MSRRAGMMAGVVLLTLPALALDNKPTRFWNPASATIVELYRSSPRAGTWVENLTKNNGAVDHDERRKLPGVGTGEYDARLVDAKGRRCFVPDVAVLADEAS